MTMVMVLVLMMAVAVVVAVVVVKMIKIKIERIIFHNYIPVCPTNKMEHILSWCSAVGSSCFWPWMTPSAVRIRKKSSAH